MAIIVHVSDTALGEQAIERAVEEASLRGEPLVLTSSLTTSRNELGGDDFRQRREEAHAALEARASRLEERGVPCRVSLASSPIGAAEAVLEAAEEHDASLIVVGIQRRSPVGKLVLGSLTQDILLRANCAVLGVKLPRGMDDRA